MSATKTMVEIGTVGNPPPPGPIKTLDLPDTIVLNNAKLCNLWCQHCYYPEYTLKREAAPPTGEPLYMSMALFAPIADELGQWEKKPVLRIASDGEPLMNPDCLAMIQYAKDRGITIALTTNGILLSERTIEKLLATRIDVIDVSIDAATAENYGDVRRSRSGFNFYTKVETNVRNLIAARDRFEGTPKTKVMVNMIDQPKVHDEIKLFADQWTEWGADAVLIRPFHSSSTLTLQEGVATAVSGVERFPCKYPFTRLNVGFDRENHPVAYYCSHDWEDKTVVGTIGVDGTIRQIWANAPINEIRRRHIENDFPKDSFCGPCPDWYLGWGKSHSQLVRKLK